MKVVIGDIHGCSDELAALLDKSGPGSSDPVYGLGDQFDRGPNNREVLRLFTEMPNFRAIKGNHERKHGLIADGRCRPALSQVLTMAELGGEYPRLLANT